MNIFSYFKGEKPLEIDDLKLLQTQANILNNAYNLFSIFSSLELDNYSLNNFIKDIDNHKSLIYFSLLQSGSLADFEILYKKKIIKDKPNSETILINRLSCALVLACMDDLILKFNVKNFNNLLDCFNEIKDKDELQSLFRMAFLKMPLENYQLMQELASNLNITKAGKLNLKFTEQDIKNLFTSEKKNKEKEAFVNSVLNAPKIKESQFYNLDLLLKSVSTLDLKEAIALINGKNTLSEIIEILIINSMVK